MGKPVGGWLAGAAVLLLASSAPAPAQEAKGWKEYSRGHAEVKAYRVLNREADGVREVLLRTACLPGQEESWSCGASLEIYRKLSVLVMPRLVTFSMKPPEGGERPRPAERLSRYAIDCAGKRYAPLSIEWRASGGEKITRIEYPAREWRPLDRIEDLGRQVCG
ncbi:MAG: hypothetical protein A3J27_00505 [Candidatus Tectomicrobia bacterium RIFCSPLOWO2_12_FULL_69_37]|nr:MAG: hypothetical protein A3I72_04670 [Candidatus Tectomicrobia bacterium RIFCSPLOWO2_02_FULL_70_19]OGL64769.1 MAG: hypothetical protein A3J27_00505 [Candidatus Tectomicrobia bacterium RIFCSPLOWO2_12_FULL_69_37]